MQFTADGDFNDHPKTWNLPDSAVALWTRAGEWSAHNAQYGFVPADMLARFCGDPVQAAGELLARGLWRRVKGGYQFCDWGKVGETAAQAAQQEADAEAKRKYDAERQRKSRANRRAAHTGKIRAGATVTGDVTGMSHVTSRDTPIDRSNQDQSSSGVNQSDAYASDPALLRFVAAEFSKKAGRIIGDAEAAAVIRTLTKRAEDAGTVIENAKRYFGASVRRAADVELLLVGDPPPLREILAEPIAEPPPDGHAFAEGDHGLCKVCEMPEANRSKHPERRTA